ncbi:MAG: glycosyltransferase [Alkaliphilus sp.]
MGKIKVLHVINSLAMGGAEELILNICKNINQKKFLVEVVVLQKEMEPIGNELKETGVKVHILKCLHNPLDIRKTIKLIKIIKKYKPDIIHSHLFDSNFHARIAGILCNIKSLIIHEHSTYHQKEKFFRFPIYADRLLSRFTYKIIAISNAVKNFTVRQERISENKFEVIRNCIPVDKFIKQDRVSIKHNIRERLGIKQNSFLIISVASLTKQKGHKYLLEALASLKIKNTMLLLVGDGPLRKDLNDQVKKLNLNDKVIFLGIRRDIPELLAASDLFVLSSVWEGQGLVVLEAMASGLPIVATNVGGVPEVVTEKEGYLVEPKNSQALANAITKIKSDITANKFNRDSICLRVKQNYDIKQYINLLEQLYCDSLIK